MLPQLNQDGSALSKSEEGKATLEEVRGGEGWEGAKEGGGRVVRYTSIALSLCLLLKLNIHTTTYAHTNSSRARTRI